MVDAIRGITTAAFILILAAAMIEFIEESPLIPGITFGSVNTVIAAIVVLVLVNMAASQTVKQERKKYEANGAMLCKACQGTAKMEAEQAKQAQMAEMERWNAELQTMTESDASLRVIVQEWKTANQNAVPSRGTIAALLGAINFEKAGNFEGAAKIYEEQKLWAQAGKVREKARVQTVKHVTVDMNQLIEQIGTRGLAVPYKCHNCGASITIDKNTSVSGLKFCSYCGTAYNIEDMSKIVKEALSY